MNDDQQHVLHVPGVEVADLSLARWFVRRQLEPSVPENVVHDLELVASELVTNACAHAAPASVRVGVGTASGRATVTVEWTSSTPSFLPDVADWTMAAPQELTGRGLAVVRSIADDVEIEQRDGRLVIAAHRRFDPG